MPNPIVPAPTTATRWIIGSNRLHRGRQPQPVEDAAQGHLPARLVAARSQIAQGLEEARGAGEIVAAVEHGEAEPVVYPQPPARDEIRVRDGFRDVDVGELGKVLVV